MPIALIVLGMDALDAPGNFYFFEGASYGRLLLILIIPNGDIVPRIVEVFALVVGASTVVIPPPFFYQTIALFKLKWNAASSIKMQLLWKSRSVIDHLTTQSYLC